ncbi:AMP-dependent synthetase/ligase [Salinispira pacifica]|uniref:Long-chain-fatty-acid--CoA ligase n=1 Tax=Salinispira pacifica TaxID=1307761 RepID=V5WIM9_9SPIO|nr:AMP-binding protein [Salinispira pacifica]AHC15687.1 Long-chain-fatty-acid--CoA ligase [Salinispira pacifica]
MNTIIEMLEWSARRYGDRSYLKIKGENRWNETSFRQADDLSSAAAGWFLRRGTPRGERCIILSEGSSQWVLGELAVLKAGLVSVPLSIQLLSEEIAYRQNHSRAAYFMVSANLLPKLLQSLESFSASPFIILLDEPGQDQIEKLNSLGMTEGEHYIRWKEILTQGREIVSGKPELLKNSLAEISPDDTATISYTSGTTGTPKGIMLTHRNYVANSTAAADDFQLPEGSAETLVILPLDHSFAHTVVIYAGIYKGITLWFVDARGGSSRMVRNIPVNLLEAQPSFLLTVPALSGNFMKKIQQGVREKGGLVSRLFDAGIEAGIAMIGDGYRRPSLGVRLRHALPFFLARTLIFPAVVKQVFGSRIGFCVGGGAILEVKQQEFFAALGVPVFQGYGLTEATPVICTNTPARHKFGSSGSVLHNVDCKIIREDGSAAETGETGELVITAPSVMKGYYRNEEASREALHNGSLHTGDRGYFDEDGFLYVVGRQKALLINPSGEKYPPEEIEEAVINTGDLFDQVMAYCDHQPATTVLLTLNREACAHAFQQEGIENADDALEYLNKEFSSCRDPEVAGKKIPLMWTPKVFEILEEPFSTENGLLNSTMKIVRHKVATAYEERIRQIYEDNSVFNSRNRETITNLFFK